VSESLARRLSCSLNWDELTLNNLPIDRDWFKITKFIRQFSITLLPTKVINAFFDRITLQTESVTLSSVGRLPFSFGTRPLRLHS